MPQKLWIVYYMANIYTTYTPREIGKTSVVNILSRRYYGLLIRFVFYFNFLLIDKIVYKDPLINFTISFAVHPYNTQVNRISSVEEGRRVLLTNVAFVRFPFNALHFFFPFFSFFCALLMLRKQMHKLWWKLHNAQNITPPLKRVIPLKLAKRKSS